MVFFILSPLVCNNGIMSVLLRRVFVGLRQRVIGSWHRCSWSCNKIHLQQRGEPPPPTIQTRFKWFGLSDSDSLRSALLPTSLQCSDHPSAPSIFSHLISKHDKHIYSHKHFAYTPDCVLFFSLWPPYLNRENRANTTSIIIFTKTTLKRRPAFRADQSCCSRCCAPAFGRCCCCWRPPSIGRCAVSRGSVATRSATARWCCSRSAWAAAVPLVLSSSSRPMTPLAVAAGEKTWVLGDRLVASCCVPVRRKLMVFVRFFDNVARARLELVGWDAAHGRRAHRAVPSETGAAGWCDRRWGASRFLPGNFALKPLGDLGYDFVIYIVTILLGEQPEQVSTHIWW